MELLPAKAVHRSTTMLAKVIAHSATREEARRRLVLALEDTVALGVTTNRQFSCSRVAAPGVCSWRCDDEFHRPTFFREQRRDAASATGPAHARGRGGAFVRGARYGDSERARCQSWSSTGIAVWPLRLTLGDTDHPATVTSQGANYYSVALGKGTVEISIRERGEDDVSFIAMGLQQTARFAFCENTLYLELNGVTINVTRDRP